MANMEIRPLMARVAVMRPDLHGTHHIAHALFEAIRLVATRTHLMRETVTLTVSAASDRVTIAPSSGNSLLKVWRVTGKLDTDASYTYLDEAAFQEFDSWAASAAPSTTRFPGYWAQRGELLIFSAAPATQGSVKAEISYTPTFEKDTYDLPEIATEAIIAWAEGFLLKIPGPNVNLNYAQSRENDYKRCINQLRGLSYFGESGELGLRLLP